MLKKAFQITLLVGLAILGLSTMLPAAVVAGTAQGIYGNIFANTLSGGVIVYFLALPFVAMLSFSDKKILSTIGLCLGIGVAVLNFYAFAVAVNNIDGVPDAGVNVGPIFGLIGAIAVLAIILVKIFADMFGPKITEKVQSADILYWKDLLDKDIITKEEFNKKKDEILKLNVEEKVHSPEPPSDVE